MKGSQILVSFHTNLKSIFVEYYCVSLDFILKKFLALLINCSTFLKVLPIYHFSILGCQFYVLTYLKNVQDDETTLSEEEKLERVDAIDPNDEVKS